MPARQFPYFIIFFIFYFYAVFSIETGELMASQYFYALVFRLACEELIELVAPHHDFVSIRSNPIIFRNNNNFAALICYNPVRQLYEFINGFSHYPRALDRHPYTLVLLN